jgi:hypothetical protein
MQSKIVCKFHLTEKGCQHGNACTFQHISKQNAGQFKSTTPNVDIKSSKIASFTTSPNNSLTAPVVSKHPPTANDNHNDLWHFQDKQHSNPDGEYFYGAYRTNNTDGTSCDVPMKKFTDLFTTSSSDHTTINNSDNKKHPKAKSFDTHKLCSFYIAGNCRYGATCHHIHSIVPTDTSVGLLTEITDTHQNMKDIDNHTETTNFVLEGEIEAAKLAECGICLELIGT